MKLAHLHLEDPFGNPFTLICNYNEEGEYISYKLYSSHGSSGMANSLSNLQCTLPLEKSSPNQTAEQFKDELIKFINKESTEKVVHSVEKVTF